MCAHFHVCACCACMCVHACAKARYQYWVSSSILHFIFLRFILLVYVVSILPPYAHVHFVHAWCLKREDRAAVWNWRQEWLWTAKWVLENQTRVLARTASALNLEQSLQPFTFISEISHWTWSSTRTRLLEYLDGEPQGSACLCVHIAGVMRSHC